MTPRQRGQAIDQRLPGESRCGGSAISAPATALPRELGPVRGPAATAFLAAALILCPAARADEPLLRIPITESSTLAGSGVSGVLRIERAEILARQPRELLEVLRDVPGLYADRPGGPGGVGSLYIRGGDPNFALVLIDGVKVNDPGNSRGGSFDFATVDPGEIERIEVLRGAAATAYGAEALGGVVNIVTRAGEAGARAEAELGEGHARLRAAAGAQRPGRDYSLAAGYADLRDPRLHSSMDAAAVRGAVALQDAAGAHALRLGLRLAAGEAASFPDDSGGPRHAVRRETERRDSEELLASLNYRHARGAAMALHADAGLYLRREEVDSPGVAPGLRDPFGVPPIASTQRLRRAQGQLRGELLPGADWRLVAGIAAEREEAELRSLMGLGGAPLAADFELGRSTWAPFVQAAHAATDRVSLEGALRLDLPQDHRRRLSPRLGARYQAPGGTLWRLHWGGSFKLPSFYALGHPVVGNPALRPETGRGAELSLEAPLASGRAALTAAVFHQRYRDLIDFDPGPPPRLVNRARVSIAGIELGGRIALTPRHELSVQAEELDIDVHGEAAALRGRPERRLRASLRWQARDDTRVRLDARYTGEVFDSSIPTGDRALAGHLVADLAVERRFSARWSAALAIDNVGDRDYEEAVGFPAPGRRLRVQVQAGW